MQTQLAYLEDVIDESIEMIPLSPTAFDGYMAEGWRLLGHSIVRHSFSVCRGKMCRTIPLRIRLEGFEFSKSQRRLLRRAEQLTVEYGPIHLTPSKLELFALHAGKRFDERRPESIASFLTANSHQEPVTGMEFFIKDEQDALACSFMHIGEETMSGTYCFYHPNDRRYSLGSLTMLLEIAKAQALGKKYYYHGYVYDVPSQFDYKLNFNNLEAMDWQTGEWTPRKRVPVRRWAELVKGEFEDGVESGLGAGKQG